MFRKLNFDVGRIAEIGLYNVRGVMTEKEIISYTSGDSVTTSSRTGLSVITIRGETFIMSENSDLPAIITGTRTIGGVKQDFAMYSAMDNRDPLKCGVPSVTERPFVVKISTQRPVEKVVKEGGLYYELPDTLDVRAMDVNGDIQRFLIPELSSIISRSKVTSVKDDGDIPPYNVRSIKASSLAGYASDVGQLVPIEVNTSKGDKVIVDNPSYLTFGDMYSSDYIMRMVMSASVLLHIHYMHVRADDSPILSIRSQIRNKVWWSPHSCHECSTRQLLLDERSEYYKFNCKNHNEKIIKEVFKRNLLKTWSDELITTVSEDPCICATHPQSPSTDVDMEVSEPSSPSATVELGKRKFPNEFGSPSSKRLCSSGSTGVKPPSSYERIPLECLNPEEME